MEVNLVPVTTTSSIDSSEVKENDTLSVSPTTKLVTLFCVTKPGAETTILYGPPGLKPPAKYFPLLSVVLTTVEFVGSYVISTFAPLTAPSEDWTVPDISDVSSWVRMKGEKNKVNKDNFTKLRIIVNKSPLS